MADATKPRQDKYTPGPGPYFEVEANDEADILSGELSYGCLVTLSSGKAVPAAAEGRCAVSRGWRYDEAQAKYFVQLDGSGALVECVFTSAAVGAVEAVDNQTVQARAANDHHTGHCVKVVSTNVGLVMLMHFGNAVVPA